MDYFRKTFLIGVFIVILILYLSHNYNIKNWKQQDTHLDTSLINNRILDVKYWNLRVNVKTKKTRYYFKPKISHHNNFKIFQNFAEKGDSIYKEKYSDTLILIKDGKNYYYPLLFEKRSYPSCN